MRFYFLSSFFWVSLLLAKTNQKGRVLLFLARTLLIVRSYNFSIQTLPMFFILYIFVGDILIIFLITCLREVKKREIFSLWKLFLSLTLLFFIGRNIICSFLFSIFSNFFWIRISLLSLSLGILLLSKIIPKTQNRNL